ncbi:DUF4376 domain-containing protein [Enterobacter ludwigii]|uniref:DUF4376 domain-containing protein n=1 Tax=Enterobacter ludwigii TaxID=299767 RepID=UPI002A7EC34A|nr:DUF4376 domain-containing protein [Enterobacter ludwigii]
MNIKEIKNARYLESGAIDCEIRFHGDDSFIPFTATAEDTAELGRRVWQELRSGKWGEIAPFRVTPEMMAVAKEAKKREIEAWRTEQEAKPFTFEWNGHTWNAGRDSLDRLAPVAMAAKVAGARAMLGWGDASNVTVSLTMAQLQELAAAMAQAQLNRNNKIYQRQREMKDALKAVEDLTKIRNFQVK